MGRIIRKFKDGSLLEYDKGAFDDWCVYLTRPDAMRYAPKDYQYFKRLTEYGSEYGNNQIYNDFVQIYNVTTKSLEDAVFELIDRLSEKYGEKAIDIAIDFSIIYMGMVAEENKAYTKLGKRVKRLGIHQVLIDGLPYNMAANFSRGKKWRDLDNECKQRGF